jgi:hypothetical protein
MATLTTEEKTLVNGAMNAAKASILASVASADADTLGKQIDDLDADSTEVEILAAYDDYRAYRLPTVDTLMQAVIAKARAT